MFTQSLSKSYTNLGRYAFGTNQWAFSTGLSAHDLVTMLVLLWLLAICTGQKVITYLGDISDAFDKIFVPLGNFCRGLDFDMLLL